MRKSEEMAQIILAELDGADVAPLTHDERVNKIKELEQAGRTDILEILNILLGFRDEHS